MYYSISLLVFFSSLFFLIKISPLLGLIDKPSDRKIHIKPTPAVGGIAIFFTIFIISFFLDLNDQLFSIVYSTFFILIIGVIDDKFQLKVSIRFFVQVMASLIIIANEVRIIDLGSLFYNYPIHLGSLSLVFTILCVLSLTNAINFIDGIDGLASGMTIVALFSMMFFSYYDFKLIDNNLITIFLIILIVFFFCNVFNFHIFKCFLGDSGSASLGFLTAWLMIYYTMPSSRHINPALIIWCVALPIFDLLTIVIRRLYLRINPLRPDNRHIHHLLMNKSFSPLFTLAILLCLAVIFSVFGLTIYLYFGSSISLLSFVLLFFLYLYFNIIFFDFS